MPRSFRAQAAVVLLLGTLLIPVATSSLRGLTHVVSCATPVSARFDAEVPTQGEDPAPVLLDPTQQTRPDPGASIITTTRPTTTSTPRTAPAEQEAVCGGITVAMTLSTPKPEVLRIDLTVRNTGRTRWRGTIRLVVGQDRFPLDLGSLPAETTKRRAIEVDIDSEVERVQGDLLLGP